MIESFDHVALPIQRVEEMLTFYSNLGFRIDRSLEPQLYQAYLHNQKINFHGPKLWGSQRFSLKGPAARPGCGDLCVTWSGTARALRALLQAHDIEVIEGPVERDGGSGLGVSVYVRDPDQNLIEFIRY